MEEIMNCRICGNTSGNTPYIAREMMYGLRDSFSYFQCAQCHCLQIESIPTEMSRYYPADYYSFHPYTGKKFKGIKGGFKRLQYKSAVSREGFVSKCITALFDVPDYRIFKGLNVNENSRILDVGCGNGRSFLYPLAEIGFKNLLGCDPYLDATIDYSNGLKIQNCSILDLQNQCDIITYHHSFEHIANPQENLNHVSKLLAPDGVCIIRIPTVSSFAWEHYRTNWAQLDAPRHFFLHSVESMKLLGEKAGLELYEVIYDSRHFQFSGSEKYVADTALSVPRKKGLMQLLSRKWKKRSYTRRARQLNREKRGDQAGFFFRIKR
jgi:SAM-dependent methyltransferase